MDLKEMDFKKNYLETLERVGPVVAGFDRERRRWERQYMVEYFANIPYALMGGESARRYSRQFVLSVIGDMKAGLGDVCADDFRDPLRRFEVFRIPGKERELAPFLDRAVLVMLRNWRRKGTYPEGYDIDSIIERYEKKVTDHPMAQWDHYFSFGTRGYWDNG